jgi:hypothetical protein
LQDRLREAGLSQFKQELDIIAQRARAKENRLIQVIIDDSHVEERDNVMLETYIESTVGNQFRAKNLVQAVHWFKLGDTPLVLVRHEDPAHEKRDDINDKIEREYSVRRTIDIFSPQRIRLSASQ